MLAHWCAVSTRVVSAALVALLVIGCAGCGGRGKSSAPPATATQPAPPLRLVVYFVRDGRVAPVAVRVPHTAAVANAAVKALVAGPPAGYQTALPADLDARVTSVEGGVAKLEVSRALDNRANAQLAYTLTSIPHVTGFTYDGAKDPDSGQPTDAPLTRRDFERYVPPILIESPLPHDRVTSPVRVEGTASVFEATLVVELVQNGAVVEKQTVTATEGAPYRGDFETTLRGGDRGPATVVAFAPNAAGGPPQHRVDVPIEITP
jgi:hypothetical protein